MVISIVAGIAVPVITIGLPIYMGRKVLALGFPWSCSLLSLAAHGQRPGQIHSAQHCHCVSPCHHFFPTAPHCGEPICCPPQHPLRGRVFSTWGGGGMNRGLCGPGCCLRTPELCWQCCHGCPSLGRGSGGLGSGGWSSAGVRKSRDRAWGLCVSAEPLQLPRFSSRCWARAGGAACQGASSASLSPAVSSSLCLCPPSSQLSQWVSVPGQHWGHCPRAGERGASA